MNEERVDVHEKALDLPAKPGVYIMQGKNHEVIYVGKAKRLVNRVSSYFRENPNHNLKTRLMVSHVWDFDYIVTDTEFEALVLENSLIKRHMPKYNILLKDDKGYPFIRVSVNDDYPTFTVVSKPQKDGARYFGPYSGRSYSKAAIDAVRTALMLPCCARKFPRDIGK
ncbi:MAG: GIY-YIG nuclease family protein, partial [Oscillospiraceae bacterium]